MTIFDIEYELKGTLKIEHDGEDGLADEIDDAFRLMLSELEPGISDLVINEVEVSVAVRCPGSGHSPKSVSTQEMFYNCPGCGNGYSWRCIEVDGASVDDEASAAGAVAAGVGVLDEHTVSHRVFCS